MLTLDRSVEKEPEEIWWMYAGGAEGARSLLSTVAGSVVTVASLVFSITIVVLSQVSSQFGPRILRNFMRDTGNQFVLGTFVSTFLYCLLVLRSIQGENRPVPHFSVTVAVLLAASSICVLIYFIHHVSHSIQAPQIIATVWRDIHSGIARMPSKNQGNDSHYQDELPAKEFPGDFSGNAAAIPARCSGYIQAIDQGGLMHLAQANNLWLKLLFRPGDFVIEGNPLLLAWPLPDNDEIIARIHETFIIDRYRTPEQDVEFAIRQMVEIAVRALSPGINDPYTACNCIDWLGDALCRVTDAQLQSPYQYDNDHVLRIVMNVSTYDGIVDAALNQIRQNGSDSPAVMIRLMETIARVAERAKSPAKVASLRKHAQIVWRQGQQCLPDESDQRDLRERYEVVQSLIGNEPSESVVLLG